MHTAQRALPHAQKSFYLLHSFGVVLTLSSCASFDLSIYGRIHMAFCNACIFFGHLLCPLCVAISGSLISLCVRQELRVWFSHNTTTFSIFLDNTISVVSVLFLLGHSLLGYGYGWARGYYAASDWRNLVGCREHSKALELPAWERRVAPLFGSLVGDWVASG